MHGDKVTYSDLRTFKAPKRRLAALTTYDYPTTRLLDETGVPVLLVGDSLGMVVLGYPDTTHVSMDDMIHHTRACARAKPRALLAADLPYRSYETPREALSNARRLLDAGAEAVKAEGGRAIAEQVAALTANGIPFIGHLGMLPQHVLEEGGYRKKGRTEAEVNGLLADADALVEAGASAIVLELLLPNVAERLTQRIPIPTIGIGSGSGCDGQILVIHDLIGAFPWFRPKFVTPRGDVAKLIKQAVSEWMTDVCDLAG
jgi:3-methyl-2-oxobutanoate hydroxymethyltransferase